MGDDIGWMQPSIYHRGLMVGETPNIDRIGNEGAIFMTYYAEQSCTAGRNAFFTGMNPLRTGMIPPQLPGSPTYLKPGTPTIAWFLCDLGYNTGEFGKNHLGDHTDALPTAHGFHEFWGYRHVRYSARAGRRHCGRHQIRLRQGRQTVPDQGAEAAAQQQQCRQARGHSSDDRAPAGRSLWQLGRRPRNARVRRSGRRRAADDAGAARRRDTRYAYGPAQGLRDTKVGAFTQALYDEAKKKGWTVISMKNDWKKIFAFE